MNNHIIHTKNMFPNFSRQLYAPMKSPITVNNRQCYFNNHLKLLCQFVFLLEDEEEDQFKLNNIFK